MARRNPRTADEAPFAGLEDRLAEWECGAIVVTVQRRSAVPQRIGMLHAQCTALVKWPAPMRNMAAAMLRPVAPIPIRRHNRQTMEPTIAWSSSDAMLYGKAWKRNARNSRKNTACPIGRMKPGSHWVKRWPMSRLA